MKSLKGSAVYTGVDNINSKNYVVEKFNAQQLSSYLKGRYTSLGKDFNSYNATNVTSISGEDNREIYEYQNFALFVKDGEYILLDGFRRLLIYDAPNMDIYVRVYDILDFTDKELLNLITYYNQYKMVGSSGGAYFDRGFALLLDLVFDINILNIRTQFVGYIEKEYTQSRYSVTGKQKPKWETIKERIVTDYFIDDLKFIREVSEKLSSCREADFGAILFKLRMDGYRGSFDVDRFLNDVKDNKAVQAQEETLMTYRGDSRGNAALKQIITLYSSILLTHIGVEVPKTYAEKLVETKELFEVLKKDKEYFKISGYQNFDRITKLCKKYGFDEFSLKVLVYPHPDGGKGWETEGVEYGVHEDFDLVNGSVGWNLYNRPIVDVKRGDFRVTHTGTAGYSSIPTRPWTELSTPIGYSNTKCVVFLKKKGCTKKELEKLIKES